MKKTYMNPTMEVVNIEANGCLMTVSNGEAGIYQKEVNGSSALGRDYDFDDED